MFGRSDESGNYLAQCQLCRLRRGRGRSELMTPKTALSIAVGTVHGRAGQPIDDCPTLLVVVAAAVWPVGLAVGVVALVAGHPVVAAAPVALALVTPLVGAGLESACPSPGRRCQTALPRQRAATHRSLKSAIVAPPRSVGYRVSRPR